MSSFVVAGEALVDVVVPLDGPVSRRPGGSPLNVAVGLSRLGIATLLATEVGDDAPGRLVVDHVLGSGVVLHDAAVVPGLATSTATATIDATGAASYVFDLRWTMAPVELPADAAAVHVGSIGAAVRPGRESVVRLAQDAAHRDLLVTFDPNPRPAFTPDVGRAWADVVEVASLAQVVKMSEEDLDFLQPGVEPLVVARSLLAGRTRLVVVTFGGRGAVGVTADAEVEVASRTTEVTDTVGAGDSFMAALVGVALEHGVEDLDETRLRGYLVAAHEAASITVSRQGADPPRREELPAAWPHL